MNALSGQESTGELPVGVGELAERSKHTVHNIEWLVVQTRCLDGLNRTMTSLSNKLLLTQPNTNTDFTTKKSGFTSFHDNLNNEFKLGSFQTKNNVTVLAPAHQAHLNPKSSE